MLTLLRLHTSYTSKRLHRLLASSMKDQTDPSAAAAGSTAPWHAAFPAPKSKPASISREKILQILQKPETGISSTLLVDVRRTDFEGGTIRGSLNLPAQSFWWQREVLCGLCKKAEINFVVFYCGKKFSVGLPSDPFGSGLPITLSLKSLLCPGLCRRIFLHQRLRRTATDWYCCRIFTGKRSSVRWLVSRLSRQSRRGLCASPGS